MTDIYVIFRYDMNSHGMKSKMKLISLFSYIYLNYFNK